MIGFFVVGKITKPYYMMDFESFSIFFLGNTTNLAGIFVSLSSLLCLFSPVFPPGTTRTIFPVWMFSPCIPFCRTLKTTKLFSKTRLNLKDLTTLFTFSSLSYFLRFRETFLRTIFSWVSVVLGSMFELFTTNLTRNKFRWFFIVVLIITFYGTIYGILRWGTIKFSFAIFTNSIGIFLFCFMLTGIRAIISIPVIRERECFSASQALSGFHLFSKRKIPRQVGRWCQGSNPKTHRGINKIITNIQLNKKCAAWDIATLTLNIIAQMFTASKKRASQSGGQDQPGGAGRIAAILYTANWAGMMKKDDLIIKAAEWWANWLREDCNGRPISCGDLFTDVLMDGAKFLVGPKEFTEDEADLFQAYLEDEIVTWLKGVAWNEDNPRFATVARIIKTEYGPMGPLLQAAKRANLNLYFTLPHKTRMFIDPDGLKVEGGHYVGNVIWQWRGDDHA